MELMGWALLIQLGAAVATAAALVGLALLIGPALLSPSQFLSSFVGVLAAVCGIELAEVAMAAVFLTGFHQVHSGRYEYGLTHAHSVDRALVYLAVFAVLGVAGHQPPVNAVNLACGAGSMLGGLVGSVSTCLTGPVNAIISTTGERTRQYTSGLLVGLLVIAFGALAPTFTHLMLATPKAFIAMLGGLAMLRVLQSAFITSFRTTHTFGALITFIVTVANVPIFNIGAPFWGLVIGFLCSKLLEPGDFAKLPKNG